MNNANRKRLEEATMLINQALEIITEVKDDEEEKFYNLPESLQSSEKGEKMQQGIEHLEEAISSIEDSVIEALEFASE
jgi:hypothetical protein